MPAGGLDFLDIMKDWDQSQLEQICLMQSVKYLFIYSQREFRNTIIATYSACVRAGLFLCEHVFRVRASKERTL